jgi:hypothetical protein
VIVIQEYLHRISENRPGWRLDHAQRTQVGQQRSSERGVRRFALPRACRRQKNPSVLAAASSPAQIPSSSRQRLKSASSRRCFLTAEAE